MQMLRMIDVFRRKVTVSAFPFSENRIDVFRAA